MAPDPPAHASSPYRPLAAAMAWSCALVLGAVTVPISGSQTLVDENGDGVLLTLALPALITVLVSLAVWCKRGGVAAADRVAWGLIALLGVYSLLGILSVGALVAPVALLLALAVSRTAAP